MDNFDVQVSRNLRGKKLEYDGDYLGAIELYELNIEENFKVVTHIADCQFFTEKEKCTKMKLGC